MGFMGGQPPEDGWARSPVTRRFTRGRSRRSADFGMVFELGIEEPDSVLHKTEWRRRRVLVRAVAYEEFLEPARMEAHQQLDGLPREIGVSVADARRHTHE